VDRRQFLAQLGPPLAQERLEIAPDGRRLIMAPTPWSSTPSTSVGGVPAFSSAPKAALRLLRWIN